MDRDRDEQQAIYPGAEFDSIEFSTGDPSPSDVLRPAPPVISELSLREPNELGRYSEWDLDFRQIEPGPMTTNVALRPGAAVTLLRIEMDRSVHQYGSSPGAGVTVGLPLSPAMRSFGGLEGDATGLLAFGCVSEFECVSEPGFKGVTITIEPSCLDNVADRIGLRLQNELYVTTSQSVRNWTAQFRRLSAIAAALTRDPARPFSTRDQEDYVTELLSAFAEGEKFEDKSMPSLRSRSVRTALDLMMEYVRDGMSIAEMCGEIGVNYRTLERGFREEFGIGPKAYFNRLRLDRARSDLLRGGEDVMVADIANAWGFWHMGQFAKDYRRMFGELPSATRIRPAAFA